jgi:hypothetical protein
LGEPSQPITQAAAFAAPQEGRLLPPHPARDAILMLALSRYRFEIVRRQRHPNAASQSKRLSRKNQSGNFARAGQLGLRRHVNAIDCCLSRIYLRIPHISSYHARFI